MNDHEFLQKYEIGNWDFTPRIYKILALSVLINFTTIFAVSQTNLLNARACDSYFVGKVCSVLDAVYVASKFVTGDTGYIVEDYVKTAIDEADVVWVDQTGVASNFKYPEGFFYKEPEPEAETESINFDPYILPPEPRSSSLYRAPKLPKRNKNAVEGELDDDIFSQDTEKPEKGEKEAEDPSKKGTEAVANKDGVEDKTGDKEKLEEATAKKSEPVTGIVINKKPLQDFADHTLVKWQKKEVDLGQEFLVKMTGEIDKNGRLNPKKSKFSNQSGDAEMIAVAKEAIESVGDSGWLDYLSRFDVKKVNLIFTQNDKELIALVDSVLPSNEKAASAASGMSQIVQFALLSHNNGIKTFKDDELALLKAVKITSEGRFLKINFNIAKPKAQEMIDFRLREFEAKKLKKKTEKETAPPPNGATVESTVEKNSAK